LIAPFVFRVSDTRDGIVGTLPPVARGSILTEPSPLSPCGAQSFHGIADIPAASGRKVWNNSPVSLRPHRAAGPEIADIPYSKRTSVSVDSLLDWVFRYREGGFEALVRKSRNDRGQSRTIAPLIADLIERLKRKTPI
jgi:hypothetical protein